MEVGKKYRGVNSPKGQFDVQALWITPSGGVVVKRLYGGGLEFLIHACELHRWKEVKDPVVKYVHWYKSPGGAFITATIDSPNHGNFYSRYTYIKTDRVECDG